MEISGQRKQQAPRSSSWNLSVCWGWGRYFPKQTRRLERLKANGGPRWQVKELTVGIEDRVGAAGGICEKMHNVFVSRTDQRAGGTWPRLGPVRGHGQSLGWWSRKGHKMNVSVPQEEGALSIVKRLTT